jgi:hypothetical protein
MVLDQNHHKQRERVSIIQKLVADFLKPPAFFQQRTTPGYA